MEAVRLVGLHACTPLPDVAHGGSDEKKVSVCSAFFLADGGGIGVVPLTAK